MNGKRVFLCELTYTTCESKYASYIERGITDVIFRKRTACAF